MKKKILVVDDEPDVSGLFKEVLEGGGYDVTVVNRGKDALLLLKKKNKFDLILLDMFMPVMSGRETFEHIKDQKLLGKGKIAFLTVSELEEQGRAELLFLGASDYMIKPISNEDLLINVKIILDG